MLTENYNSFFDWIGEDNHMYVIVIITFVAHVLMYHLLYIPFFLVEVSPFLLQYKIQRGRIPTNAMRWKCFKQVIWQQFTGQLPLIVWTPLLFKYVGNKYLGPLPSLPTIIGTCILSLMIEDTWHYWTHRLVHAVPALHQFIHKLHHEHFYPFALTAEYATVSETLTLGIGTMIGPLVFKAHWVTMLVWMVVRDWESLDAHSGYDLPWSPHRWIPFWGGAMFHDKHHSDVLGNYSSTFTWWDKMCNTAISEKKSKKSS